MERLIRTTVEFSGPFEIEGLDGLQPAGTYDVETIEEMLEVLSTVAYRRVSTTIARHGARTRQLTTINPACLEAALKRDAEAHHGRV